MAAYKFLRGAGVGSAEPGARDAAVRHVLSMIVAGAYLVCGDATAGTPAPPRMSADDAWEDIYASHQRLEGNVEDGSVEYWLWWNGVREQRRSRGLEFWKRFKNDPRRYKWLQNTVAAPPFYWKDLHQGAKACADKSPHLAVIDERRKDAWESEYIALRAVFMADPEVADEQRATLVDQELRHLIAESKYRLRRTGEGSLASLASRVVDYVRLYPDAEHYLAQSPTREMFGLLDRDPKSQQSFLAALRASSRADARPTLDGWGRILALRDAPMKLIAHAANGRRVDLSELRGRVVLVDFWSLGCDACIGAMSRLQGVYEKYQRDGFEIVSVCLSFGLPKYADESRIERVLKHNGVTWLNVNLSAAGDDEVRRRFSIASVPMTFLLNREGRLVTTDVSGRRLELQVRRLLGMPCPVGVRGGVGGGAAD